MTVPELPRGQVNIARDHATQNIVQGGNQYVYGREPAHHVEAFPLTMPAPDLAWLLEQPSRLLDARSQVVDFAGRDQELQYLSEWRDAPRAALSVRLLHGPGGQGKTRLATRFAQLSGREDWTVLQAQYGVAQASPADNARGVQAGGPHSLLMIVDYADRWPHGDLLRLLTDPLLHQGLPSRVLLLGRSVQWWPAMRGELAELRAATDDLLLPQLAGTPQARGEVFDAARDRFAELLGVDQPARIRPPAALTDATYGLVLALHMAALVAVDAYGRGQRPPTDPEGLAAYLLDREHMNWRRLYGSRTRGEEFQTPPSVMARTVFTAVLTGPARHTAGTTVLKNLELESPSRILTDHRVCYPPTDRAMVLEPLYPDRLAEDFLALLLPGHSVTGYDPDPWAADAPVTLLARSSDGKAPAHTPRTITFLAASAARWPHAAEQLNAVLGADPALAVDAGSAALTALADVSAVEIAVLEAIEARFPDHRDVDLDPGIAAITSRLTQHRLARTTDPAVHARLHIALAYRLMNAGQHHQALAPSKVAVIIRRRLAEADPAAHRPDLAGALSNLGLVLSGLGRREQALYPSQEATQVFRQLAEANPAAYQPNLATSLNNLGLVLSGLGRREDALLSSQEAAVVYRRVAEANPTAYLNDLAMSLSNLGHMLSGLGRREEALAPTQEAVAIRRRLAEANPAAYLPDLAISLSNLGLWLSALGRREEALPPSQEAMAIRRRLAEANPAAYLPDLAMSLTNLGHMLSGLGRREQALPPSQEAAGLYRRLAEANPAAYLPDLAASLNNLGLRLAELGRRDDALGPSQEAVTIRRRLAEANPAAYLPDLAQGLWGFAEVRTAVGVELPEALTAIGEATEIYKRLAEQRPDAFARDLWSAHHTMANILAGLGRTNEADGLRRRLAADTM